jgi:hypothetical protein
MSAIGGIASALLRPPVRVAERAGIAVLEAALASPVTEQAVNLVLDSPIIEHTITRALKGPLVDAIARDLGPLADRLLAAGIADDIARRMIEGPELERIVVAAIESPGAARLGDRLLDSPQAERLVARVIESRLVDEAVARLLESKDLWLLVDEVARSPSVTEAISHQSMGFAEEMAGVVRERSHKADARVERLARRLFRREVVDGDNA